MAVVTGDNQRVTIALITHVLLQLCSDGSSKTLKLKGSFKNKSVMSNLT